MWLVERGRIALANRPAAELFGAEQFVGSAAPIISASADGGPVQTSITRSDGSHVRVVLLSWMAGPDVSVFEAKTLDRTPVDLPSSLLESKADCIHILNLEGRLTFVNPGGRELMGSDSGILNRDWLTIWEDEHRESAERALEDARQGRTSRFTGRTSDKQIRWWDVVVSPMRDSAGLVTGMLSISRDVTQMKHAQALEQIEREVLEATASTRPLLEVLNGVCRLAEFAVEGRGRCSVLTVSDSSEEQLRVASAPSIPDLIGMTISRTALENGGAAMENCLKIAEAVDSLRVPLRGPDGQPLGVFVLWTNIETSECTELSKEIGTSVNLATVALTRDAHLRRLRNKQARLAAMSRSMPVGLYQADVTGHWIYSNDRHAEMTGLTLEQSDQEGWLESVHAEDREMVREVWREARAAGSDFRAEYRLIHFRGGEPQWVVADETPTREGGCIGTITDITEMRRALTAVAEGAERFQTLANNISPFCWMADANGRIFWYNERWYDYTGTTFDDLQGEGWRTVHHPDHIERVIEKMNRHWETGEAWEDTFPLRDKHGNYRWFLSQALPIRDSSGRITRWFGTNSDVTQLRQLEAKMHRQNRALQRSNEDLTRFAFIASHDLQEPLRMISSYAQLVQRTAAESLDEKSSGHIAKIVDGAARMTQLIRDLLVYAQASAETAPPAEMIPLSRVVPAVIENLRALIEESGATITFDQLPEVCAVEAQIAQVFQNLLSNALKYRRHDVPLVVTVTAEREGPQWRISVRDNGQGFDQEYATRIFDFLKRLHGKDVPRSGLGLAICKTIIERNGGTIGAEGQPGVGAAFWFTLPAHP
jgi:PAS domain S-box-containing protein